MYFFDCYRREHPSENIVLAAFSPPNPETGTGPQLLSCVMWNATSKEFEELKEVPKDPKVCKLQLYDGIPGVYVSANLGIKMVTFTSPNRDWIKIMLKHGLSFTAIYMPNWTLQEQQDGRDTLQLNISDAALLESWNYFGGTVRYTLKTVETQFQKDQIFQLIKGAKQNVVDAIASLQDATAVKDCLQGDFSTAHVRHRIFHYEINRGNRGEFYPPFKVASRYIASEIYSHLTTKLDQDHKKLMTWLEGVGKTGTFSAWLFEGLAHEKLLDGVAFELVNLSNKSEKIDFTMNKTQGEYSRFKPSVPIEHLFREVYRIPADSNLRSVDAYYIDEDGVIWLIQVTRNVDHDINALGIVELLEKMGKLDSFLGNSTAVNLVFVVPKTVLSNFAVQKVWTPLVLNPDSASEDIEKMECDAIQGIKAVKKRRLNGMGIKTVKDILETMASRPADLSFVHSYVAQFQKDLSVRKHFNAVKKTRQYVAALPVDDDISNLLAEMAQTSPE